MRVGRRLFAEHCQMCHTLLDKRYDHTVRGVEWGPDFNEVKPIPDYVEDRIRTGGFGMASFSSELYPDEIAALVRYVSSLSGRDVDRGADEGRPSRATMRVGATVFDQVCRACHSIAGRRTTENLGSEGWLGTNFMNVKPSVPFIRRAVRRGYYWMPPIRGLSRRQIDAVAAYVHHVSGEDEDGDTTTGDDPWAKQR